MFAQEWIEREFEELEVSDAGDKFDFATRVGLILISSVALFFATSYWLFLAWGFGYAVLDTGNLVLIRATSRPVSQRRFWLLIAMSVAAVSWVSAMAVHLSFINGGEHFFLGCCLCVGFALYTLTNHASFSLASYIDLFGVLATSFGVTLGMMQTAQSPGIAVAMAIGALAVMSYFGLCFRKTIGDRIKLRESIDARAHDQKLKSLGQLTTGVAHDFNNLLTVVGGNIELAMLELESSEQIARLDEAKHAAERGAALVAQLLSYSRKSALNAQKVLSIEVLSRVDEMARRVVPAAIGLEVDLAGDHAALMVDEGLLETAILNLLFNARDAMSGQYGLLRVSTHMLPDEGFLAIAVEDSGPGMEPAIMERAAEPFFTTKGPGYGTGLGLSMVKGFAEQSGGSLVLSNRVGGGLVASILLPTLEDSSLPEPV
ncbi:MAG: ATP-binding protein [Pseudomonadota bacterium]